MLGLKTRTDLKSTFPGQLKNVLIFNPRWLETRIMVKKTFCKVLFSHALIQFKMFQDHKWGSRRFNKVQEGSIRVHKFPKGSRDTRM